MKKSKFDDWYQVEKWNVRVFRIPNMGSFHVNPLMLLWFEHSVPADFVNY